MADQTPDWQKLELLVLSIQKQLSPEASVQHNVMLDGIDSEVPRQIDILVEQNVGQYTMKIVIDCKDYKKPIDVKAVEEFSGLIQDVRAHKGALVCLSGFTKSALRRARKLQIDLYRPVSTDNHKWQATVTAPVICEFRSGLISFQISCSSPKPMKLESDFYNLPVYDEQGNQLGSAWELAQSKWDDGQYPREPGEYEDLKVSDGKTLIFNGYYDRVEVELKIKLKVVSELYIGHLAIEELNGLQDEHTGAVVTNAFTTDAIRPDDIEKNWTKIQDAEDLAFEPLFKVIGYYSYTS